MLYIKSIMDMRGMKRSEITDYFSNLGLEDKGSGKYIGHSFEVEISEESPIKLGSIEIPSTKVILRGEKAVLEKVIAAFRLKFLSAGG